MHEQTSPCAPVAQTLPNANRTVDGANGIVPDEQTTPPPPPYTYTYTHDGEPVVRPIVAVDSTKTKNTATASSVITRTDRSGCVADTLAATNCTQMAADIRCAMRTNKSANAVTPRPPSSSWEGFEWTVCRPPPTAPVARRWKWNEEYDILNHAVISCVRAIATAPGSAPSKTVTDNTMPINSADWTCASSAASSNSLAIENETDIVRSPPKDARASETPRVPPPCISNVNLRTVSIRCDDLRYVSQEGCALERREGCARLHLRRLLLASETGAHRRQREHRRAAPYEQRVIGAICGTTFKNIAAFAGTTASKRDTTTLLYDLAQFLQLAADALEHVDGADRDVLAMGLAAYRITGVQRRSLPEYRALANSRRCYADRAKLSSVAVGATAAMLVSFYALYKRKGCADADAANQLIRELDTVSSALVDSLRRWSHGTSLRHSSCDDAAIVELRCAHRARKALEACDQIVKGRSVIASTRLRMQLESMRSAAWPAGGTCDAQEHASIIARIDCNDLVARSQRCRGRSAAAIPLSALPSMHSVAMELALRETRDDHDDNTSSSFESTAFGSGSSHPSSVSSVASCACNEEDDNDVVDVGRLFCSSFVALAP